MEDRGRGHALRAPLREVRQHEHGLARHRRVQSRHPLPGHGRADARPVQLPRQRRLEVDRRRQDLDQRRAQAELLHQQGPGRSQEPGRRLRRGRGQALRQRHGLRARLLRDDRRRQDLGAALAARRPRRRRLRRRPARLQRRHRPGLQALPPELDLHRPPAGQQPLQVGRRRQDLEEARGRPAEPARGRPGRPGHLPQEPEHRLRPDRRRGQPRAGRARRRRQLPGLDAVRRRPVRREHVVRQVQGLQDQSRPGQGGAQVHAHRRGRRGRAGEEAERDRRRQGLSDQVGHRSGQVQRGGPQGLRREKGGPRVDQGDRGAPEAGSPQGRLERGQGTRPGHEPPRPRDALRRRPRRPGAGQAGRRHLPVRGPRRDLEEDDGVQAHAAAAASSTRPRPATTPGSTSTPRTTRSSTPATPTSPSRTTAARPSSPPAGIPGPTSSTSTTAPSGSTRRTPTTS